MLPQEAATLIARYAALAERIASLEAERDAVRDELLEALGDSRGRFASPRGVVRVLDRPTCRFDHTRVVAALEDARFLRDVALVQPARLRRAMEENLALGRAVAPLVEPVTYAYVDVVPRAGSPRSMRAWRGHAAAQI